MTAKLAPLSLSSNQHCNFLANTSVTCSTPTTPIGSELLCPGPPSLPAYFFPFLLFFSFLFSAELVAIRHMCGSLNA